jgi:hypothetical protein
MICGVSINTMDACAEICDENWRRYCVCVGTVGVPYRIRYPPRNAELRYFGVVMCRNLVTCCFDCGIRI